MNEEWLIFPVVKASVARMATVARWLLLVSLLLSLAELLLWLVVVVVEWPWGGALAALSGLLAEPAWQLGFLMLVTVAAWCHVCLLAERGVGFTRWGMLLVMFFACVMVAGTLWKLVFGEPMLVNQGVLPYILTVVFGAIVWSNLPYAAAAPKALLWRVGLFPLFLLAAVILDIPGPMLLPALLMKAVAVWLIESPLRLLSAAAPRVIGLPPKAESQGTRG